jgi:hypothetical protein
MSFPGLERCDHGEYLNRECLRCEIERLRAELGVAKGIANALLRQLHNHVDTPDVHPDFDWLKGTDE